MPFPLRLSRILLTNDDGIDAPGLAALESIAADFADEVWVVAPQHDESGTGQSLSLHHPLRAWPKGERRWAVGGTPGDCVALAISYLMKERPSLILSGVNAGINLGDDVNLSGTLGAAFTGLMLEVPSVAISQDCVSRTKARWEISKAILPTLLTHLLIQSWPKDTCLSVNIPNRNPSEISGFSWACQDYKTMGAINVEARADLREQDYYWLSLSDRDSPPKSGSDRAIIQRGEISVTALSLDRSIKVNSPSVVFAKAPSHANK